MNRIGLEPVDRVEVTVLMDNVTDPLLVDQEAVTRMNWPKALVGGLPTARARVSPDSGVPDALIAEPGFSALVRIEKDGRERTLLFDTGVSPRDGREHAPARALCSLEHRGVLVEHLLDLARATVVSTADDHFLLTVDDEEVAVSSTRARSPV